MGIRVNVDREAEQYEELIKKAEENIKEGEDAVVEYVERQMEDVYIPPNEEEVLRKMYAQSVVQDFDDIFHLSEKEQLQYMRGREKLHEYIKHRTRCTLLSEYVNLWRLALEVIDEYAEDNIVMSKEEFRRKAVQGKIIINGLGLPKFVGKTKDKKNYNWEFICSYIENPQLDPIELDEMFLNKPKVDDLNEEDSVVLPQIQEIIDHSPEGIENEDAIVDFSMKVVEGKKLRKQRKVLPSMAKEGRDQLNAFRKSARIRARANNEIDADDFGWISRYNRMRGIKKEIPEFKGEILNHKDVDKYIRKLDEYDHESTVIQYNGKAYTQNEIDVAEFRTALDKAGWDLRKCYVDKEANKRRKRQEKKDKKREKKIKEVLTEIQNRQSKRKEKLSSMPEGVDVKSLKKKSKKKKKRKKKKKKSTNSDYKKILTDASPKKRLKNLEKKKRAMKEEDW